MKFVEHQKSFTIVVLKEIKIPGYLQASWLHDIGILNEEEWKSVRVTLLGQNISQFSIGENMQLLCNAERIQIGTNDVTKIDRLVSICQGIIDCFDVENDKFIAVGINTEFLFSFINKEDSIKFGDYFVPFKNWKSLTNTPRVNEFAVTDEAQSSASTPRKGIKFSSVGNVSIKNGDNIPIINANSNYHFEVKNRKGVESVLDNADKYFTDFLTFIDNFLKEIELD